eukprot:748382-Hanusia_phi.AAC.5
MSSALASSARPSLIYPCDLLPLLPPPPSSLHRSPPPPSRRNCHGLQGFVANAPVILIPAQPRTSILAFPAMLIPAGKDASDLAGEGDGGGGELWR